MPARLTGPVLSAVYLFWSEDFHHCFLKWNWEEGEGGGTVKSGALYPAFYVYMCWISQHPDRKQLSHSNWVIRSESVVQLCPTLCDPMDCRPLGSSVCGISQSRILEWVAIFFSRGSSQPKDQTWVSHVSCIGRWVLYYCVLSCFSCVCFFVTL